MVEGSEGKGESDGSRRRGVRGVEGSEESEEKGTREVREVRGKGKA